MMRVGRVKNKSWKTVNRSIYLRETECVSNIKVLWGKLWVICDSGLYTWNWLDLNSSLQATTQTKSIWNVCNRDNKAIMLKGITQISQFKTTQQHHKTISAGWKSWICCLPTVFTTNSKHQLKKNQTKKSDWY